MGLKKHPPYHPKLKISLVYPTCLFENYITSNFFDAFLEILKTLRIYLKILALHSKESKVEFEIKKLISRFKIDKGSPSNKSVAFRIVSKNQ